MLFHERESEIDLRRQRLRHVGCWAGLVLLIAATAGAREGRAPARKKTVLLLGDSFVVSAFGVTLEHLLDEHAALVGHRQGKSSSGLARPDFFNWFEEGRRQVAKHRPDLVVVMMGGNDGQDLAAWGEHPQVHWKTPRWPAAYRARMVAFVKSIQAPGRKVLWLGLPPMGAPRFEKKVEFIRKLQREALRGMKDVSYLDTRPLLTGKSGRLLPYAPSPRKGARRERIRDPDGVHFTVAGGRFFARQVWPSLLAQLGLS